MPVFDYPLLLSSSLYFTIHTCVLRSFASSLPCFLIPCILSPLYLAFSCAVYPLIPSCVKLSLTFRVGFYLFITCLELVLLLGLYTFALLLDCSLSQINYSTYPDLLVHFFSSDYSCFVVIDTFCSISWLLYYLSLLYAMLSSFLVCFFPACVVSYCFLLFAPLSQCLLIIVACICLFRVASCCYLLCLVLCSYLAFYHLLCLWFSSGSCRFFCALFFDYGSHTLFIILCFIFHLFWAVPLSPWISDSCCLTLRLDASFCPVDSPVFCNVPVFFYGSSYLFFTIISLNVLTIVLLITWTNRCCSCRCWS